MELEKYVSEILSKGKHATSFPDELDIPKTLVDYCWSLYQSGEKIGKEKGVNLNLADGKLVIGDEVFRRFILGCR